MSVQVDDLAKRIHETAVSKGFWEQERNLGEMIMLIVSELSEALEEDRNNKGDLYFVEGKPEGVVVELADAVIRCLDTCWKYWDPGYGTMQENLEEFYILQSVPTVAWPDTDNFGEHLMRITILAGRALDPNVLWLMHVVTYCVRLAEQRGHNIWEIAQTKMAYNDTRPYKHGKKY